MKKQEETRQAEENARKAEYQAMQAQHETVFFFLYQAFVNFLFDSTSFFESTQRYLSVDRSLMNRSFC